MIRTRILLFLVIFQAFIGLNLDGQDLHFSQWFNSPLTTNPANTGFIPDADYRPWGELSKSMVFGNGGTL